MIKQILKARVKEMLFKVPSELSTRHVKLSIEQAEAIRHSLETHYHVGWRSKQSYTPAMYEIDVQAHLVVRLENDRMRIMPWLNKAKKLKGSSVLEIGCGTGASTLALAEQGAEVTGIDIDEGALKVAVDRLRIAGQRADFHAMNAENIRQKFDGKNFDFIIFYATLEHMTIEERVITLDHAWKMLAPGAVLAVIETPNRLWFNDHHTSQLPFFNWLPDDLAFHYSRFSKRDNFKELYRTLNEENMNHFLRRGRGASYHEFEVAIAPMEELNVVSNLADFENVNFIRFSRLERQYTSFLRGVKKNINKGFCYPNLDIIIQKK
jgi:2-polyprenyl-3-methyl-5-hydroxy-6-metoxy-1,4-benzoquinol methylase